MRVVATAGHVDHGKSTLVLALTGTDPDRFEEEKRRGSTIDLGFAHTTLPSGAGISFVDVPGHVRFLRNMLAGVGAVDACLFVVAATEGWKPQSEEHLRILEMLGIRHGVIVLDQARSRRRRVARDRRASTSPITWPARSSPSAPIVAVAAPSGDGLDELRAALDELVARTPPAPDRGRARLWIDRVFAAKGSGTVVTGTLTDGSIRRDDQLVVEPGARPARVRGIQTLGAAVDAIEPGNRVALNLSGVAQDELHRGDCVVAPGRWRATDRFDATLDVLASLGHEVSRRGAYMAYVGSRELPVRLRLLGADALGAGRARLGARVPARAAAAAARRSLRAARVGTRRDDRRRRGARHRAGHEGVAGRARRHRRAGDRRARLGRRRRARAADRRRRRTGGRPLGDDPRDAGRPRASAWVRRSRPRASTESTRRHWPSTSVRSC